mgnify:CR=1 FL=1
MKINFLKRLESSIYSFAITMERTVAKIEDLISKIEKFNALQEKEEPATLPTPTKLPSPNTSGAWWKTYR